MAWKLSFKKDALKILSKQSSDTQERIKTSIRNLLNHLDRGVFPLNEMDIKKLRGERKDFLRLRIGDIRVIFKMDTSNSEVRIYAINHRGSIYKK